ncbi:MAG: phage virion morphogenesis protein [Desulfobulbaceae bacterium]|jgi:phage virion morphogenesis protein
MAGVAIRIETAEGRKVGNLVLDGLLSRMADPSPGLHIAGATVQASIARNFEKEGRPQRWAPLADSTLRSKPNTQILQVKGWGGGLLGSINYRVLPRSVLIGTNKKHGAIHQYGGKAGRGHKTKIPARPYLMVQQEDWIEIRAGIGDYLAEGKK